MYSDSFFNEASKAAETSFLSTNSINSVQTTNDEPIQGALETLEEVDRIIAEAYDRLGIPEPENIKSIPASLKHLISVLESIARLTEWMNKSSLKIDS